MDTLEQKDSTILEERCSWRQTYACQRECYETCRNFLDADCNDLSEEEIIRRYRAVKMSE